MAFWDFLFGGREKAKKTQRYTPEQMEMFEQMMQGGGLEQNPLYQQGSDFLQRLLGGDTSAFEGPLMQQFQQETLPGVAEQFGGLQSGMGSGLNQALARASENLGTQLGAQRAGLMAQSLPQALGYAQAPFQQQQQMLELDPYDRYIQQASPGLLGQMAGGFGSALGAGVSDPLTRFIGSQAGRLLGQ